MISILSHLSDPAFRLLGLSLLHFLWQGTLIALALKVILNGCQRSQSRYLWAFWALGLMALTPVVTYLTVLRLSANGGVDLSAPLNGLFGPSLDHSPWAAWLVIGWLAGVLALSFRALINLRALAVLRRSGRRVSGELADRCRQLARRMAPGWKVEFRITALIDSPVVVGWLRPLVLLPLSAVTRTPPEELEALLLHELAHVRRLDAFANLLQIMVETLLFYHPAVWWVSGVMRTEREHCCDDLAVSVTGDPARYVMALANMEEARLVNDLALGAAGGSLVLRARRQLVAPAIVSDSLSWLRLVVVAVILALVVMASGLVGRPLQVKTIASLAVPVQTLTQALSVPDFTPVPASAVSQAPPLAASEAMPANPVSVASIPAEEPTRLSLPEPAAAPVQPPVTDTPTVIASLDAKAAADRAQKINEQIDAVRQADHDYAVAATAYEAANDARQKTLEDIQHLAVSVVFEGAGQVSQAFRAGGRSGVILAGDTATRTSLQTIGGDHVDQAKLRAYLLSLPITRQLDQTTRALEIGRQAVLAAAQNQQDARASLSQLMRN